jgi:hypothetical protein
MKLILRSGNAVDYPRSASDITLAQYIDWHNNVRLTIPSEILEFDALATRLAEMKKNYTNMEDYFEITTELERLNYVNDNLWLSKNWHPYQLRVVRSLTGIQDELTVDELKYLFDKCTDALLQPKDITYKQIYLHEGVTYTLPSELMRRSTLVEFAETAQYESALKQTQGGDATGLLNMCAVLLRPSGVEQYSEEVFERNVQAFQTLPLMVAHEVSFFLTWLSSKYALSLNHSTMQMLVKQMQD